MGDAGPHRYFHVDWLPPLLGETARARWLQTLVGTRQDLLVERPGDRGHIGNFAEVLLDEPAIPGDIVRITITGATNDRLRATRELT